MGFFFTLLYLLTAYLSPEVLFGSLAEFHVEVLLAGITLVFTLIAASEAGLLRMTQFYAMLGLIAGIVLSVALGFMISAAPGALLDFLPQCIAFFFIVINCRTKRHLQWLVAVQIVVAVFIIYQGHTALAHDNGGDNPYLFRMHNDTLEDIARIRGLSFLGDPNDLAQFLVGLIPCTFFFWNKKNKALSTLIVLPIVAVLVYGMFLTHSRGAMVALLAVVITASRKKIGVLPSLIGGGLLFVGLSASGWSGGREISSDSGSDRTDAWATGLEMLRSHPIFGVGYAKFTEYYPITAHNTIVVCAAELGFLGFFFWILLTATTLRDTARLSADPALARAKKARKEAKANSFFADRAGVSPPGPESAQGFAAALPLPFGAKLSSAVGEPLSLAQAPSLAVAETPGGGAPFEFSVQPIRTPDEEVRRLAGLMLVCLSGFFAASWFLSRAFIMPLFVYVAMTTVVFRMGRELEDPPVTIPLVGAMKFAFKVSVGLIVLMYVMLRVNNVLGH